MGHRRGGSLKASSSEATLKKQYLKKLEAFSISFQEEIGELLVRKDQELKSMSMRKLPNYARQIRQRAIKRNKNHDKKRQKIVNEIAKEELRSVMIQNCYNVQAHLDKFRRLKHSKQSMAAKQECIEINKNYREILGIRKEFKQIAVENILNFYNDQMNIKKEKIDNEMYKREKQSKTFQTKRKNLNLLFNKFKTSKTNF